MMTFTRTVRGPLACRARLAMAAAAFALCLAAASPAHADTCRQRNFVDRLALFLDGSVRATSSDGETYDRIQAGDFRAEFQVDLCGDGALNGVIVHLGECTGDSRGCDSMPVMYEEFPSARDFFKTRTFSFAIPPGSGAGRSVLQTCNAHADEQRGAANDKKIFPGFFGVTLGVETRRDPGRLGSDAIGFDSTVDVGVPSEFRPLAEYSKTAPSRLTLEILCAPLPQPIKAPPKVTDAAIGVAVTSRNMCPRPATAEVIIAASAPRAVRYKIERGNGTTTTPGWIEGRIRKQKNLAGGESPFLRTEHSLGSLDPGTRKFRLWIDGWGKTPWRTVDVDCPPFKVTSARLKYEVEKGPTCPKKVAETATFTSNRPGTAPFKIKTQGGLVVHSGKAKFERDGNEYVARLTRPNLPMKAFDQDMMAEITNQPGANSGWTRLKVECQYKPSGASATSDFTPDQGRPDDPLPPQHTLEGDFSFVDTGGTTCPRQGKALIGFVTSRQANVHYSLDCTNGSFSGVAQAVPGSNGGFVAPALVTFDIAQTTQASCALKSVAPGKPQVHTLKGHLFQCVKPSGVSGTGDLAPPSRPNPASVGSGKAVEPRRDPAKPGVKAKAAAPVQVKTPAAKSKASIKVAPKIKCVGGTVRRGKCDCPDGKVLEKGVCTTASRKR